MKPTSILNDSTSQWTYWKFSFIAFILICLLSSLLLAADNQHSKAVRRSSSDQRRVALVIGNSDYKVGPLQNPAHDAEDISGVLRTLGFAVQTKINANQPEMEEAVDRFVQEIQNGDVALFYFSGHGVQVKGENYLIPLGDPIKSETDVRYKTVNAGLILGKMEESRNRANIVILDACRNNPFKGLFRSPSMGLSKMDAPKGTFIAYATSPDSVAADGTGRNSPYTKHLMEALKVKNLPIEQAFKQVARAVNKETAGQQTPWILSSLLDDLYCNPSNQASLRVTEPARMTASPGSEPPDYKAQLEREKRESEQEIAKLREARRVAALERERIEREKQEMLRERERVASLSAPTPPRPSTSEESEVVKMQRLAEQGNATAQNNLGDNYRLGKGVPRDYQEALKWYRKAAEQGNAWGQYYLGMMYANGFGVPKDGAEAVKWYRKAADQGFATAQTQLGIMYMNGFGVPKDGAEAVKWYRKAVEQGDGLAQYNLGLMYKYGNGVAKDQAEARKLLQKLADQGMEAAKVELQNLGATSSK